MTDPRHKRRIQIVQNLYSSLFETNGQMAEFPHKSEEIMHSTKLILDRHKEIDSLIQEYAPKYSLDKIAKTDLSILRLAVYELQYEKDTPQKVVINEAVELGKEMGNERTYAFINAVLGAILSKKQ